MLEGIRFPALPPAAVTRILATFDRSQLEGFIAVAIDLLDLADGDPDLEEPGLEDGFVRHFPVGPGCPIADPDYGIEDVPHDAEEDCCAAGDDGCGPIYRHGHRVWGYAGTDS